jgi:hypothetical protein
MDGASIGSVDISIKGLDLVRLRIMTVDLGGTTSPARTSTARTPPTYGMKMICGTPPSALPLPVRKQVERRAGGRDRTDGYRLQSGT